MKKYKFWIITGIVFLVLMVSYLLLVSNGREDASREERQKSSAISDLENLRKSAIEGKIPSNAAVESVSAAALALKGKIQEIDSYIKDNQKDFLYVKGDKDWKYTAESTLQYKSWYNKKRDEIFTQLRHSNFVFEVEGKAELDPTDEDRIKENIGFTIWGSDAPNEKEILESQQKLALINLVADVLSNVFKDRKSMFPIFQKLSTENWMELDTLNGIQKSKAVLKLDCPFAMINIIINELEKSKLRIKIDNIDVSKKTNSKDFSEFPNVSMVLNLSFQVIAERKVSQ